ncbi:MAG: Fe-S-containing hydro-lyase [Candidatus Omnitrophota bacterium]
MKRILLPLTKDTIRKLKVGDEVLLTGRIYTARDAAHKRICECIKGRKKLPIPLAGEIIYYCGPTPAMPGKAIGSCGPTTSKRMDSFTAPLLSKNLFGMIGKGDRSKEVESAIKKYHAVYFTACGGAGAYLAGKVKRSKVAAYKDLGPEAIHELWVEDFPVIVAIDSKGRNIYKLIEQGAA